MVMTKTMKLLALALAAYSTSAIVTHRSSSFRTMMTPRRKMSSARRLVRAQPEGNLGLVLSETNRENRMTRLLRYLSLAHYSFLSNQYRVSSRTRTSVSSHLFLLGD